MDNGLGAGGPGEEEPLDAGAGEEVPEDGPGGTSGWQKFSTEAPEGTDVPLGKDGVRASDSTASVVCEPEAGDTGRGRGTGQNGPWALMLEHRHWLVTVGSGLLRQYLRVLRFGDGFRTWAPRIYDYEWVQKASKGTRFTDEEKGRRGVPPGDLSWFRAMDCADCAEETRNGWDERQRKDREDRKRRTTILDNVEVVMMRSDSHRLSHFVQPEIPLPPEVPFSEMKVLEMGANFGRKWIHFI